eukprot:gene9920-20629_t
MVRSISCINLITSGLRLSKSQIRSRNYTTNVRTKVAVSMYSTYRNFHHSRRSDKRDFYEGKLNIQYQLSLLFLNKHQRHQYLVLGVPKDAPKTDIKKKYFEMAKKYHPDVNKDDPSAGAKFREASEAYEILENDEKRKLYDSYGHAGIDPNSGFGGGGGNPFAGGFGGGNPFGGFGGFGGVQWEFRDGSSNQMNNENITDIFEELFGGGGGRREKARRGHGMDVRTSIRLSFLEAVNGCTKDVQVDVPTKTGKTKQMKRKEVTLKIPKG